MEPFPLAMLALTFNTLTFGEGFRASTSSWALPGTACVELGSGPMAAERGEDVAMSLLESRPLPAWRRDADSRHPMDGSYPSHESLLHTLSLPLH